jgi:hypothetical protein
MRLLATLFTAPLLIYKAFCADSTPQFSPLLDRGGEVSKRTSGNSEFVATVANKSLPPGKAPEGMVWIQGANFRWAPTSTLGD